MPTYAYKALDRQGKQTAGGLPAGNRAVAFHQRAARGLSPISVNEQSAANGGAAGGSRLSRLFGPAAPADGTAPAQTLEYAKRLSPPAATKVSKASLESFTREMANLLA